VVAPADCSFGAWLGQQCPFLNHRGAPDFDCQRRYCSLDRYGRLGGGGTPDILPPGVFIGAVLVPHALLHDARDRLPCGSSGLLAVDVEAWLGASS